MTINELEQGLRNLIASDPAVLSGNLGEVIRGVMGVAEAYHNYIFHVQSYPVQDVFKFSLLSETGKFENNLAGLAQAMLQERGINLLLYIPQNAYPNQYAPNGFAPMGQMAYNPANQMGTMPNSAYAVPPMQNPIYSKPNSILQSMGQPVMNTGVAKPKITSSFTKYQPTGKPTYASIINHNEKAEISKASEKNDEANDMVSNHSEKSSVEVNFNTPVENKVSDNNDETKKAASSPAEMLMGEADGTSSEKAAGRDYLLELLKK